MNKLSLAGLAMIALVSSCSEDLSTIGNGLQKSTIGVSVSTESTRAAFDKNGNFYWSKDDQIGVMSDKTNATAFSCFTLTKGEGTASAEFTGVGSGSYTYVVYPYNDGHSLSNGKLTYLFPNTYKYEKVDQTFFPTEKDGNSYNPAMWGKVGENNNTTLKHLGGVLCVKVDKMPCQSGSVEVSADENMAGKYTATLTTSDAPALTNTETSSENPSKNVTITFSGATTGEPGVFYVPVPTGTYNNIRVKFFDGATEKVNTVAGSYKVDRANLYALILTENKIDAGVSTEVSSVADANDKLSTSDNVAITSQVETGSTITIPAASAGTTTSTKTITLEKVASKAALTVAEASGTGATTANAITVSLPKPASADDAASLTITTPNSTTTIASNAGETTINKVTASTAENTLIVSDGVTIKELEIAKGNVRINKGATVEKITANVSTIVYYEKGATVPTSSISNVKMYEIGVGQDHHVMVWDGTVTEPTATKSGDATTYEIFSGSELAWFAKQTRESSDAQTFKNATIKLMGDIDLNNLPWSGIGYDDRKDQFETHAFAGTFDGNGHTIYNLKVSSTCQDPDRATAGLFNTVATGATIKNVTIKNATISSTHYAGGIVGYSYWGGDSENPVTIENCTVDGATIITTPALKVGSTTDYDSGDKAGGIIGYLMHAKVTGCTVKNTTIKAYRDFGGIGGCANKVADDKKCEISNCTVSNVTLTVDNTYNYKPFTKRAEYKVDKIIGRPDNCVTIGTDCTAGEDVKIVYPNGVTE